jgi:hypothetical protein
MIGKGNGTNTSKTMKAYQSVLFVDKANHHLCHESWASLVRVEIHEGSHYRDHHEKPTENFV